MTQWRLTSIPNSRSEVGGKWNNGHHSHRTCAKCARKAHWCGAPKFWDIPVQTLIVTWVCAVLRWAWQFYCHGRLTCCRTLSSPPLQNGNVVMHKYPQQRGKHGKGWKSTQKHLPCIKPGKICSLNVLYACAFALIHFGNTLASQEATNSWGKLSYATVTESPFWMAVW